MNGTAPNRPADPNRLSCCIYVAACTIDVLTTGALYPPATEFEPKSCLQVLEYFKTDSDSYIVVFTPNASGAIKIVAEAYPFKAGTTYMANVDNHNSVQGTQCFAAAKGASVKYVPVLLENECRMDEVTVRELLKSEIGPEGGLYAYPAQCNVSGVQHSLGEKRICLGIRFWNLQSMGLSG